MKHVCVVVYRPRLYSSCYMLAKRRSCFIQLQNDVTNLRLFFKHFLLPMINKNIRHTGYLTMFRIQLLLYRTWIFCNTEVAFVKNVFTITWPCMLIDISLFPFQESNCTCKEVCSSRMRLSQLLCCLVQACCKGA